MSNQAHPYQNSAAILFGGYGGAGDLLRKNAEVLGNQTGLSFSGFGADVRLSWRELNARVCRLANALRKLGLQRGDRVALFARNSHQWVEALFGLAKIGAVSVTVNYRLTAPEVEYIVSNAGARAILCGATEAETARTVADSVDSVRWLIGVNGATGAGIEAYETLVASGAEDEPQLEAPLRFDEPALLLYTSGTTGFPKGAIYTHGSLLVGMFVHVHAIGSRRTHRVMLPSPLYSAAGIAGIYCAVFVGSQIALLNFEARLALETIQRERITFTNLVPTTIQMLLARADIGTYDLSSLEVLLYGGSPMPEPVLRDAMVRLPNCSFRQTFAATETGCSGTVLEPREHREALENPALTHRLLSCGRPQVCVDVQVFGVDGQVLPPGEVGEIGVRTEANMTGYWNNPEATAKTIRDGWVFTGDLARVDEDGYIYLVDRKNDLIVSGALNVYPSEVERVLHMHPAVYECAVIGVPSAEWGEAVKAVVVVRAGQTPTEAELIAHCAGQLAGFKKPKSVDFVARLPRNLTGKVLRRELREPYWLGHTRKI
ncbi:MAG: AMP-binding protein [Acidobacteria bacterium]|nr:AMP-binding protein [Acidobacteriota bacterium]MBI3428378.1 AMP-binding protein [Acidobacteriota bacterium]